MFSCQKSAWSHWCFSTTSIFGSKRSLLPVGGPGSEVHDRHQSTSGNLATDLSTLRAVLAWLAPTSFSLCVSAASPCGLSPNLSGFGCIPIIYNILRHTASKRIHASPRMMNAGIHSEMLACVRCHGGINPPPPPRPFLVGARVTGRGLGPLARSWVYMTSTPSRQLRCQLVHLSSPMAWHWWPFITSLWH